MICSEYERPKDEKNKAKKRGMNASNIYTLLMK